MLDEQEDSAGRWEECVDERLIGAKDTDAVVRKILHVKYNLRMGQDVVREDGEVVGAYLMYVDCPNPGGLRSGSSQVL